METNGPFNISGFFDIQVNGVNGIDINKGSISPEEIFTFLHGLWEKGVVRCLPTIITNSSDAIKGGITSIVHARKEDRRIRNSIPGIHLEGPYISSESGPRGAHNREFIRPPDWGEFQKLQEAAEGIIKLVTLAPELPGAIDFIEKADKAGVVVGIGHTNASSDDIEKAIGAGAKMSTHLGNGAHKILPRTKNYILDQLSRDELMASFIADGYHLPPGVIKTYLRAKGTARSILISDSIAPAGIGPGTYQLVGIRMQVRDDGFVSLVGTPYLAGSVLNLASAVENVVKFTGLSLEEVISMASNNPARLLKEEMKDCEVCMRWKDDKLEILSTKISGELVWEK